MNRTLTLGLAGLLCLAACTKRDARDPRVRQPLSLFDPAPGQQHRFVRVHLGPGDTVATSFRDTLHLEIARVSAGDIYVREYLSAASASYTGDASAVAAPYDTFSYTLRAGALALEVQPYGEGPYRSRLWTTHSDGPPTLAHAVGGGDAVALQGDRVAVRYLPTDRTHPLSNQSGAAVLLHAARERGLPGLTYVHDRATGLRLALREYDLEGSAEGWKRID